MSAFVIEDLKPALESPRIERRERAVATKPLTRPAVRPRARSVAKRRSSVWPRRLAAYAAMALLAFIGSSVTGYALTESARREALRATERARAAKADVALLRERVDRLSSVDSLESWAALRGFALPEAASAPPKEGVRVASLR